MSLSVFQSFISTASLQSVLSLPQPTPFPILPPVPTSHFRRAVKHHATKKQYSMDTRSTSNGAVEIFVFETETVRTTVISETTLAAVPDYSMPNYGSVVNAPPAADNAPPPPTATPEPVYKPEPAQPAPVRGQDAPQSDDARPNNSAPNGAPGDQHQPAAEPTSTTVVDPDRITDLDLDRGHNRHHHNKARDVVPTPTPGPVVPQANKGKPNYLALAIASALGTKPKKERPEATSSREIQGPIVSLHFGKRLATDAISTSTSGISSSPTDVLGLPSAPLKRDPTITITGSETRPTPVSLGIRGEQEQEVNRGLEARHRHHRERFSTHTIQATDPQPTIVEVKGMGDDVNSVPVGEYAFDRMPPGSRNGYGFRKRTEESGKSPDAEAGGVRILRGIGLCVLVFVGVVLVA
ncbi:hypothetical protein E2P81_ATG03449 [Venturia nashicola]|nr:hypothetical protein E2P81_ATG03449 [Venturia nashicola]